MALSKKKKEKFKKILQEEYDRLVREAQATVDDLHQEEKENLPDITDRATVESDRSFMLRIRDRERKLIGKVKEALERIDKGTYGECESCGEIIGDKRLEARPVSVLCIECKNEQEQEEKRTQS